MLGQCHHRSDYLHHVTFIEQLTYYVGFECVSSLNMTLKVVETCWLNKWMDFS